MLQCCTLEWTLLWNVCCCCCFLKDWRSSASSSRCIVWLSLPSNQQRRQGKLILDIKAYLIDWNGYEARQTPLIYSHTSTHGPLSTTATSLQLPLFWADSPYIDSCLNLFTTVASLQRPLSSVPKVAVVERFDGMFLWTWHCTTFNSIPIIDHIDQ